MNDLLTALLIVMGGAFMMLAGLGVLRMPDLFMRTQASTKAATLGAGCMLLAVAVHFGELTVVTRAVLVTAFILLTAPVSAHMIARAAYSVGTPLWKGSIADEFHGWPGGASGIGEVPDTGGTPGDRTNISSSGTLPDRPPDDEAPPPAGG